MEKRANVKEAREESLIGTLFVSQRKNVPQQPVHVFSIDSDEEECGAVKDPCVLGCPVASHELILSSPICDDCKHFGCFLCSARRRILAMDICFDVCERKCVKPQFGS